MPARLTLISHAATPATRKARFPDDEEIETKGQEAAAALRQTVGRFDRVWAAPERRVAETALAIGLTAEPSPSLRDFDLGTWRGHTLQEISDADEDAMAAWMSDPEATPHGGESLSQLLARVSNWLGQVPADRGNLAAVTHPSVIRAAVVAVLDAGPMSFWRIDVAPLARVEFFSNGRRWALRSLTQ
jgi:broad specificity phosphatase PhoE